MKEITIVDGFFDNFNIIKDSFKNIPLYNLKEFKKNLVKKLIGLVIEAII